MKKIFSFFILIGSLSLVFSFFTTDIVEAALEADPTICDYSYLNAQGKRINADDWCTASGFLYCSKENCQQNQSYDFCIDGWHYRFSCKCDSARGQGYVGCSCDPDSASKEYCYGGCRDWTCEPEKGCQTDGACDFVSLPECSNGIIEGSEQCDGVNLGGKTCKSLNLGSGDLSCKRNCTLDTSDCYLTIPTACGNGTRQWQLGEQCDIYDLGGQTCKTLGYVGGDLKCLNEQDPYGEECFFDTSRCVSPPPIPTCNTDGKCDGVCPEQCTVNEDPDCTPCRTGNECCGIGCDSYLDQDCASCKTDGLCDNECPEGCTVNEDPDCDCKDNDGCCGINCTYARDNDCEKPTPGTPGVPTPPGVTAPACYTCSPEEKGGLVPCGRSCDDPDTSKNECDPCQFCDFFVMINNIIRFVMFTLVPVVAVLMLIIGGVMFFFAGAKPAILIQAKGIITSVVIGLIIIFAAWVIVNTVLTNIGIVQSDALLRWYQIECQ